MRWKEGQFRKVEKHYLSPLKSARKCTNDTRPEVVSANERLVVPSFIY